MTQNQTVEISIPPARINDKSFIEQTLLKKLRIKSVYDWAIDRKSIDSRKQPVYKLRIKFNKTAKLIQEASPLANISSVANKEAVHIIGAGPAGYFAALELVMNGKKPIILERGKDVQRRRRDLKAIQQDAIVNPHSNYCFGEGGAGTYSDGKLYTRSQKRGKIIDILRILVEHGADPNILIDAHPHIGSNKLPKIVSALRETIEKYGGEVRFDSYVTDILIEDNKIKGLIINQELQLDSKNLILATGHSARDIYELLHSKQVEMHAKPFALGVRIEHPQPMIDYIQYGREDRQDNLPAASYRIACQVAEKGVFSFCMCPGGLIVPAATAPGELVVNGMSLSRRDSPFANSGFVTEISLGELAEYGYEGLFASLDFQQDVEQHLFDHGDGSQKAPAQRVTDFYHGQLSTDLNETSYIPGIYSAPMHDLLPSFVSDRLRQGLLLFGQKLEGYVTSQANIIGVESRTSSPIRIPRDKETLMHVEIDGLYPCGEGAGYAGGILSACMDGQRVARAIARQ